MEGDKDSEMHFAAPYERLAETHLGRADTHRMSYFDPTQELVSQSDVESQEIPIAMEGGAEKVKAGKKVVSTFQLLLKIGRLDRDGKRLLLRWLDSLPVQITVFLVILLDACLLVVEVANAALFDDIVLLWISCLILSVLTLEISLRLYLLGFRMFFVNFWNAFELCIVIASFVLLIAFWEMGKYVVLARLGRGIARILRILVMVSTRRKRPVQSLRRFVTENKMRYTQDGFDLDLAYLTDRVLIMSYPAPDLVTKMYRNDIREVARFFDTKHPDHHFIVNAVAERTYPTHLFHDRVKAVPIFDHSVATLSQLLDFCHWADEYMTGDPANVMAIHCKGGKGRTGLLACSWLLYSKQSPNAEHALTFFGKQRTDQTKRGRVQGVETSSQRRYVVYLDRLLGVVSPETQLSSIRPPDEVCYRVLCCRLAVTPRLGTKDFDPSQKWSEWRVIVKTDFRADQQRCQLFVLPLRQRRVIMTTGHDSDGFLNFEPEEGESVKVMGDTRIELAAIHDNTSEVWLFGVWVHVGMETQPYGPIPVPGSGSFSLSQRPALQFVKADVDRNRHLPPTISNPWTHVRDLRFEVVLSHIAFGEADSPCLA